MSDESTDFEGFDLFGGHAIEELPEGFNLEEGVYTDTEIESAKVFESKAGPYGIGISFKDLDPNGFGLTAFQWLAIPAPADKAQFLLRDLKALGLAGQQIVTIARSVHGTDPKTATVDEDAINSVLAEIVGNFGTTTVSSFRNKKTGKAGTNVAFELHSDTETRMPTDAEDVATDKAADADMANTTASSEAPDTDAWFGNN